MIKIKRYLSFVVVALLPLTPFAFQAGSAQARDSGSKGVALQTDTQEEAPTKQKKKKRVEKKAKKNLKNKSEKKKDRKSKNKGKGSKKKNKKDTK